jgi:hypothetical protein
MPLAAADTLCRAMDSSARLASGVMTTGCTTDRVYLGDRRSTGYKRRRERMRQLGFVFSAASTETAVEPSIRGQVRVERVLRQHLGPKVIVTLTDNRSTMISFKERRGVLYVRLHAIFADADTDLLASVSSFVRGRASKRQARMIDEWIEANRHLIKRPREDDPPLLPLGECHDLQAIFDELNTAYFDEKIVARITWTRALKNQKRTTIRMGSYCDEQKLIRIHPALDQSFVPEYFVASVVFHEMLHEVHGAEKSESGRRCVHPPAFLADERKFEHFEKAKRWEIRHIHKLLKY